MVVLGLLSSTCPGRTPDPEQDARRILGAGRDCASAFGHVPESDTLMAATCAERFSHSALVW